MAETCTSTITEQFIRCTLPPGHDGRHDDGGWVWWHGNGETCTEVDCWKCAASFATEATS